MSQINPTYIIPNSADLTASLAENDRLQKAIEEKRFSQDNLWDVIQFKLKVDWTYNSNAIEGSTLTLSETLFFLREGLTVNGKPLKDFLDARNHSEAIDLLQDAIKNKRPFSTGFMKEINALILNGVSYTAAQTPDGQSTKKKAHAGEYKKHPNHVLTPSGEIHTYVAPEQVAAEMDQLFEWIAEQERNGIHPLIMATIAHYNFVRIHPFDDGNGRGARLLMNLLFMKNGYLPAVINNENRQDYFECLQLADKGDLASFCLFVSQSLRETQESVVKILEENGNK
ncbi:Fic family protein [Desulfovibrio sp. JC022]|uniref:Fic family protein n=1 Tax=Desulfovibrio sp. JC022 TaxID=2593642 RepID=UPI0010AA02BA|nr:Fic family protein [Desulfovibrio sp. JC022]NDV24442.1 Fic family protein [Desulfovibrio sp. JC022]TIH12080.1 Fic family protein [Marinifilum sp. JC120]